MSDLILQNDAARHRYEALLDGELAGYCEYNELSDSILFTHTEVLPAFEGKGVGSFLARGALDDVRRQGRHAIPACPFIATWLRKHPDYQDLLKPEVRHAYNI